MSSGWLLILVAVGPRGVFVVVRAGLEAAVQDPDEPVGELAQRGVVVEPAVALLVVVSACAGRGVQSGEGLGDERVDETVVVHEPRERDLAFAGRGGDRAGAGVVLASLGVGVTSWGVTELGEHPGTKDRSHARLGQD